MHISSALCAASLLTGTALAAAPPPSSFSQADIANGKAITSLAKTAYDAAVKGLPANGPSRRGMGIYERAGATCTAANLKVRREW
jgi:hypothetical protein